jgi:hypothetical protein
MTIDEKVAEFEKLITMMNSVLAMAKTARSLDQTVVFQCQVQALIDLVAQIDTVLTEPVT